MFPSLLFHLSSEYWEKNAFLITEARIFFVSLTRRNISVSLILNLLREVSWVERDENILYFSKLAVSGLRKESSLPASCETIEALLMFCRQNSDDLLNVNDEFPLNRYQNICEAILETEIEARLNAR